ncbi:MAG: hypothetical protein WBP82_02150 [Leuconostoc mesenteroides]
MGFGKVIKINKNQIGKEIGRATLIKIPGKSQRLLVASKYVNDDSFWINPNWNYSLYSKNGNDNGTTISYDEIMDYFGLDDRDDDSYLIVNKPKKLGELNEIDGFTEESD